MEATGSPAAFTLPSHMIHSTSPTERRSCNTLHTLLYIFKRPSCVHVAGIVMKWHLCCHSVSIKLLLKRRKVEACSYPKAVVDNNKSKSFQCSIQMIRYCEASAVKTHRNLHCLTTKVFFFCCAAPSLSCTWLPSSDYKWKLLQTRF